MSEMLNSDIITSSVGNRLWQNGTEKDGVDASIGHVFVHKQFLMFLQANTNKPNKVLLLELGNQNKLVFQLLYPLPWTLWQPLHCNFLTITKDALRKRESFSCWKLKMLYEWLAWVWHLIDSTKASFTKPIALSKVTSGGT
jgi:hypothetical protein